MRHISDRTLFLQNWALSSVASALAAGIAGMLGLFLPAIVYDLIQAGPLLNRPADWLALPIFLVAGVLTFTFVSLILSVIGMIVSLPASATAIALMSYAERHWRRFRHPVWWCLCGLATMPFALFVLLDVIDMPALLWAPGMRLSWIVMLAVGLPSALAGALVGRHFWHSCNDAGMVLDAGPTEATSDLS